MPSVDLALQFIALQKQRFILRCKLVDDRRKGRPKPIAVQIRPWECFRIDEVKKDWVNAYSMRLYKLFHRFPRALCFLSF